MESVRFVVLEFQQVIGFWLFLGLFYSKCSQARGRAYNRCRIGGHLGYEDFQSRGYDPFGVIGIYLPTHSSCELDGL